MPGAPTSGPRGWPSALGVRPETRGKTRGWPHEAKGGLPAPQPTPDSAAKVHNKTRFVSRPRAVSHRLSTAAQVTTGLQVDGDQFASDSVIRQPVSTFCLHSGEGRKLRAKCGVLSARNAPERAGSRRIRQIRRAFSPCEVKRFASAPGCALGRLFAPPSRWRATVCAGFPAAACSPAPNACPQTAFWGQPCWFSNIPK
jgi:hypothetical protein